MCIINQSIQDCLLFDKYIKAIHKPFCYLYIVTNLAFQTDIRNKSHTCFGIHTW